MAVGSWDAYPFEVSPSPKFGPETGELKLLLC